MCPGEAKALDDAYGHFAQVAARKGLPAISEEFEAARRRTRPLKA